MNNNIFVRIYKNNFGFPSSANWGHSLFLCSIGTLIMYIIQEIIIETGTFFTTTSLIGFFLINSLLITLALLLPVATLFVEKTNNPRFKLVDSVGSYTGLGVLLLAMLSGLALPLLKIPLHNLSAWVWLKMGKSIIFPVFFCVNDGTSTLESCVSYIANTVIPAFGISLFFTGLLWFCLPKKKKLLTAFIIAISLAVFSLNPVDFLGLFACGLWLSFLRDKANNVYAPFLALLSSGIMELFITRLVPSVDITMVQVYSDMNSTFVYSSAPAFIAGIILLAFFAKPINEFNSNYYQEYGFEAKEIKDTPLSSGINLALVVAIVIFVTLWILIFRGGNV